MAAKARIVGSAIIRELERRQDEPVGAPSACNGGQGSGATKISFSQELSDLFPDLKLYSWVDGEEYSTPLFTLADTSKVSSAVIC